jgi:prepilin-type N-terminal cleavage/methylation domain-containing protein
MRKKKQEKNGFTLVELVIVLVVISILAVSLVPATTMIVTRSRTSATEKELKAIQMAIMGDPDTGLLGFRDHIGALPASLDELYDNSGAGYPAFNNYTQTGWHGPYIESTDNDDDGVIDMLEDAWGNPYTYNSGAGTVRSNGDNGIAGDADDIVANLVL